MRKQQEYKDRKKVGMKQWKNGKKKRWRGGWAKQEN